MHRDRSDLLRAAVESGDRTALRELLAPGAVLRTSNEQGRSRIEGAEAVVAHLARPGPGRISAWQAREWPSGVALTFEWAGAHTTDRRRWYVRRGSRGEVTEQRAHAPRPGGGRLGGGGARLVGAARARGARAPRGRTGAGAGVSRRGGRAT